MFIFLREHWEWDCIGIFAELKSGMVVSRFYIVVVCS